MSWFYPLRRTLPLALLLFSLPLGGLIYLDEWHRAAQHIERGQTLQATHTGHQLAGLIAAELRDGHTEGALRTLRSVITLPNLDWAVVCDQQGRVHFHTDHRHRGLHLANLPHPPPAALLERVRQQHRGLGEAALDGPEPRYWGLFPLPLAVQADTLGREQDGLLVLNFDLRHDLALARHEALRHALWGMLPLLLLALAFWLYLRRALVSRLERLTRLEYGPDGEVTIPDIGGRDEIAQLARHFQSLAQALRAGKRRWRGLFEQGAQIAVLLDGQGRILEINDRAAALFAGAALDDRSLDELPGWSPANPGRERRLPLALAHAAAGDPARLELAYQPDTGSQRQLVLWLTPLADPRGEITLILAEAHDVTALKQAEAQVQRQARFYATLSQTNAALIRCRSVDELFGRVCAIAVEQGGLLGAWIGMLDDTGEHIRVVAQAGLPEAYLAQLDIRTDPAHPHGQGPTATALRSARHQVINDFSAEPTTRPWQARAQAHGIGASAAFPLHRQGQVVGVLNLYGAEPGLFTEDLLGLLDEMARDISFGLDHLAREEALQLAGLVFDNTHDLIIIGDRDGNIESVNRAFTRITGYSAKEVQGRNPRMLQSGQQDADFYRHLWTQLQRQGHWQGEIHDQRKDGEIFPLWMRLSAVRDEAGDIQRYICVASDISASKEAEARIHHLAHFDPLTGLPNRALLHDRAEQLLRRGPRQRLAMLFLDLDNFKAINDIGGHAQGDALLREVAGALSAGVGPQDNLGRLGGDEFLIILDGVDAEGAAQRAQDLLTRVAATTADQPIALGTSIGIALYPGDGANHDELLQRAEIAMYKAKQHGRNRYHFYTPALNDEVLERLTLEAELRRAIERRQLGLHYQPQVELHSGRLLGLEALLRWQHPTLGAVSPARFIPIAEESSLITELGSWVLAQGCHQLAAWQAAGLAQGVSLSINVSLRQFSEDDLYQRVVQVLRDSGLAAGHLELEITESLLASDIDHTRTTLQRLKQLGLTIAVDDFGTGYSSLAYLKRFALDRLKIDRSFVRDLERDGDDRAIAAGIISLGHSLGLAVIAEGVETAAQRQQLIDLGCDQGQGYLFSRPLPAAAIEALLGDAQPLPRP